jgi:hypothetical protein
LIVDTSWHPIASRRIKTGNEKAVEMRAIKKKRTKEEKQKT